MPFRSSLANMLHGMANFMAKGSPPVLGGSQWTGTQFTDAYRRNRNPTPNEVISELKNMAFTCASINSATAAQYEPRLFVWSTEDMPQPNMPTKELSRHEQKRFLNQARWKRSVRVPAKTGKTAKVQEVIEHPILDLFTTPNPFLSAFDLWELTTFYLETIGSAYWLLDFDSFGTPAAIWVLPAQNISPKRKYDSRQMVDYYEYKVGSKVENYEVGRIIHFKYPDPKDPYNSGLSPLRAAWEQCAISSEYMGFKKATWENNAVPGVVISPDEIVGEEERDRLEDQWNAKFRRGGSNKALVCESGMRVAVIAHSMGDLAALADYGATKEDIANAFHVPLSYLSTNTNLANLQAAQSQHLNLCIAPRLTRRDEKLNAMFVPLYDDSGRLFLASDDPTGIDMDDDPTWFDLNIKYGIITINEARMERGLPAVPWGDKPWFPLNMAPYDFPPADAIPPGATHADYMISRGRNTSVRKIQRNQDDTANVGDQQ